MARRVQPEPQPANLSAIQIKAAIPKLERRIRELEAVSIDHWDDTLKNELDALQMKIEETLTGGHLDKFLAAPELWQWTSSWLGVFGIRLPLSG